MNCYCSDPYRQQTLSIVSLDDSLGIRGLAIDPTTGLMYGTSETALYQINPAGGEAVMVGTTSERVDWALGFDLQGNLFGVGRSERRLFSVDKSSGATMSIGEMEALPADIAAQPEDGEMYGLGFIGTPGYEYGLYKIDLSTAAISHVGQSLFRPGGMAFTKVPEPTSILLSSLFIVGGLSALRLRTWRDQGLAKSGSRPHRWGQPPHHRTKPPTTH